MERKFQLWVYNEDSVAAVHVENWMLQSMPNVQVTRFTQTRVLWERLLRAGRKPDAVMLDLASNGHRLLANIQSVRNFQVIPILATYDEQVTEQALERVQRTGVLITPKPPDRGVVMAFLQRYLGCLE